MIQSGTTIDFPELFQLIATWGNLPELQKILGTGKTMEQTMEGSRKGATQAPVTTRHSVRTNIPGASRSGGDQALAQVMMGAGVQDSQGASIARPKG